MADEIVLQVGVKILLKNKEGNYLLVKSNPQKYPEKKSRWDLVGGRINPGNSLFENLKREVLEETSLILVQQPILKSAQDILIISGKHVVRLTYVGEIEGDPILDFENTEWKWFTFEEIKMLPENEIDNYFKELIETGIINV